MENEILSVSAKNGDTKAIAELYRANSGLIYRVCRKYESSRYPLEDLLQEAYFPLIRAVEAFKPDSGHSFTTYLVNAVRWYFSRYVKQDKNKLDMCILDSPANKDQDGATVGELTADESAEFQSGIHDEIDLSRLCGVVREVLDKHYKAPKQAQESYSIIMAHSIHGMTCKQIADKLGTTPQRVRRVVDYALRLIRHPRNKKIYAYREDIISRAYRHSGLSEFKYTFTSSPEWAVMKLDEMKEDLS